MWISDLPRAAASLAVGGPLLFHAAVLGGSDRALVPAPAAVKPVQAPSPASDAPQVLTVPPALAARNATIEPSGIAWAAALGRYLVVSDDTGPLEARHAPFVLALAPTGVFDAEPVPIEGLTGLNDAEAICAGPDGTFFLVTSHSPNKEGRTHAERRMLLHLGLEGRRLKVKGRLDLTTARATDGAALLPALGLPPDGRLDIEGLTYGQGALWIGFKSPLTGDGKAVLARLADPVAALQAGRLPAGALSRAALVRLQVPALRVDPGAGGAMDKPVSQGIADLAWLPDGQMLVAANAPKMSPPDGGGAIYLYRPSDERLLLLRRFAGLKPEGVGLAADGVSWVVVFDNDRAPPSWLTLGPSVVAAHR